MTDNDRELIELAAKAYGIQVKGWLNSKLIGFDTNTEQPVNGDWNPLEDDGDAFRLAVQLRIETRFMEGFKQVQCNRDSDRNNFHLHGLIGYWGGMTVF